MELVNLSKIREIRYSHEQRSLLIVFLNGSKLGYIGSKALKKFQLLTNKKGVIMENETIVKIRKSNFETIGMLSPGDLIDTEISGVQLARMSDKIAEKTSHLEETDEFIYLHVAKMS